MSQIFREKQQDIISEERTLNEIFDSIKARIIQISDEEMTDLQAIHTTKIFIQCCEIILQNDAETELSDID